MNFIQPASEELLYLRADPLLWEQELDVRPDVAEAVEQATGKRAGQVYWRSSHDHLYGLELADLGRGRPSMAMLFGYWDRYEPRPPEHEIDSDLLNFSLWIAETVESLNPNDLIKVAQFAGINPAWPPGSVLRTPEDRFEYIENFPNKANFVEIEGLRMAWIEQGEGDPILMLHGEPTWGYLYRRMIPPMATAGRVVVPDLIGFGRSDTPVDSNAYTYKSHARWLRAFIEKLDLRNITLICHDWGGLLGLRVLARMPERFKRLVAMNTALPVGEPCSDAFMKWRRYSQRVSELDVPQLIRAALKRRMLSEAEEAAYAAPFPSKQHQTAALVFPRLVPTRPDHPGAYDNRVAIGCLEQLDIPVLLPWGSEDAITAPGAKQLLSIFRHATPLTIEGAGHFIQEDAGEEVAGHILRWIAG